MFSDVDNEEQMKKTRRTRHKKYLSDFEIDNIVEKNPDIDNEARKEIKRNPKYESVSKKKTR